MKTQIHSLPSPLRERWQPLRSGLVNLYRYDREEFHYENGRLLLRGNNGTGKSRVLALQLPFLLDGAVDPERLEPDADPSKKIEWNLLMGQYPDRTGYTWIEFGRQDASGAEHYLTLGCGLSAIAGQPGVRQWFFITKQRVGKDLELVTDSKQVLSKDRLRSKIGSAGTVLDNSGAYRRAVNEALFGLDEYRYASLLNLLIQLRRPQLTRRLDEQQLSTALSEALPPVSRSLITDLAEKFSDLQSDRSRLHSCKIGLAAVEQFLAGYRRYAEIAAKRRADRVLAAHYEYEAALKEVLEAEAECDRSLAELARLKSEIQRIASEQRALQVDIHAFQQSEHSANAQAVEETVREAAEARAEAERAAAELSDASGLRKSGGEEYVRVRATLEQNVRRLAAATELAAGAAISAGLGDIHRDCVGALDLQSADESTLRQRRDPLAAAIEMQSEKIEYAVRLIDAVASAKNELQLAGALRDQLAGLADDAHERLTAARAAHQTTISAFLGTASDWTAELTELPLPFDESFFRSVTEWCDRPHGPNPFASASTKAVENLNAGVAASRAYLKQLENRNASELSGLETEREGLVSTADPDEAQKSRLLELDASILAVQAQLDHVLDSLSELDRREGILRSEANCAPQGDDVRAAYEYTIAVSRHLDTLRSRMTEAEEYLAQKHLQLQQAMATRDRAVADLRIGERIDDLAAAKSGIAEYRVALSSLWPAVESIHEARTTCEWVRALLEHATSRETRQKDIAERLGRRAVIAEIARDSACQAIDASLAEIVERVDRARKRLEVLNTEEAEARHRFHETELAVTRLDERLRGRTAVLNGDTDRRNEAAASLRTLATTGLLKLASSEVATTDAQNWSIKRTVETAFELVSRLKSIDANDTAWENHQKMVPSQFTALMQILSARGFESSAGFRDDLFVARSVFAGQERAMDELREMLADDQLACQMLLDARTKELVENHLIGKVSSHFRDLLHGAEEQVGQMNIELGSRPMSTGMKLRFVWRLSDAASADMVEARQLWMQSGDSAEKRQLLGRFLQQQIERVCSDVEDANWQESLAEALDYRKWHRFGVERYQDGTWKRLTRRTHGTGSGGEKAIALTLPHFAAAAAFYRTADPLAPRLILLDEAFVGIDADMRAKCMGLIDTFDLDFVMTSEREWGCYQTLPGLAIYQLSTRSDIDAVGLTRWVWNGRQRTLPHNWSETSDGNGEVAELVAPGERG